MRTLKLVCRFLLVTLACAGWYRSAHSADAHAGHQEEEKTEHGVVKLTPQQLKMADLEVQPAGSAKLAQTLDGPGEIVLNEDRVAHLTPRVSGVATHVLKTIGDTVAEGEVLAVLQSPDLGSAKIEYFTAKLNLDLARLDLEREQTIHDNTRKLLELLKAETEPAEIEKQMQGQSIGDSKGKLLTTYSGLRLARSAWARAQKLQSDKLISQADYELAAKQLESAGAEFKGTYEEINFGYGQRLVQTQRALKVAETTDRNAERRLHVLGLTEKQRADLPKEKDEDIARYELRAPFAGVVLEKHITTGEHLDTVASCFTLTDTATVWCNVRIYPKDLARVKTGQTVRVKVTGEESLRTGAIAMVNPVVSEKTRAAFVRVVLENRDGLLHPGVFVTAAIVLGEVQAPITVPVAALQTFENQEIVFALGEHEREFEAKAVQRGYSDGLLVEIKSGLEAGQKIVVRNSFILKAELGKGEGGHQH